MDIVKLYKGGKSLREIGLLSGITNSTIRRKLISLGVSLRPKGGGQKIDFDRALLLYQDGLPMAKVGKELGFTESGIKNLFRKMGVDTNSKEIAERRYAKQRENIIKDYENYMYVCKISEKYGIPFVTLKPLLIKWCGEARTCKPKYKFNENYFSKLDKEGPLYFLGLIMSDGCNVKNRVLSIGLNAVDRAILEKFRKELQTKKPLSGTINQYGVEVCCLSAISKILLKDLISYGIIQRKSLVAEFKNVDYLNNPALWLGEIDGDGTFYLNKKLFRQNIALYGSKKIINQFKEFLIYQGIEVTTKIQHRPPIYCLTINRKSEVAKLIHLLYDKSTIHLSRKYRKAMSILKFIEG